MLNNIKKDALKTAGFREKYAIEHGTAKRKTENGHILYIFSYSKADQFQDGNGATYDATLHRWIN